MEFDAALKNPCTIQVVGPSQAGKTVFTQNLVQKANSIFRHPFSEIIWCYSEYQPNIQGVTFSEGLPDIDILKQNLHLHKLIVIDDMMEECSKNPLFTSIFTKGSHHWNLTVIFLTQNIFLKNMRTARLNTHYLVLFKNPADRSQIGILGSQLYPKNKSFFLSVFNDATSTPFSYLFIDLTQTTPDKLRLRANILNESKQTVYIEKKN